jgi:hypothetical protein
VIDCEFIQDTIGIECDTAADVKYQAVRVAGDMIKDQGLELWRTNRYDLFVCDEQNRTHLKLSFSAEDLTDTLK